METIKKEPAPSGIRDLRKSFRVLEREAAHLLKSDSACCGVSLAQCHVLIEIDYLGVCSLSELSSALGLDKSTMSRTVDTLVNEGYVSRTSAGTDRRSVKLALTEKGIERTAIINDVCDGYYLNILSRIPVSEHAGLIRSIGLLSSAITSVKQETGASCCGNTSSEECEI